MKLIYWNDNYLNAKYFAEDKGVFTTILLNKLDKLKRKISY